MSRAGVNTIVEGRLYQRGHMLTWPAAQKARLLAGLGVTMVVNLWCKVDPDMSATEHGATYLNWYCSPSAVPPGADAYADFVAAALRAGAVALIHCEAGRGRSVWFSARVLAAYEDCPRAEALARVKAAVPSYKLNAPLLADLEV